MFAEFLGDHRGEVALLVSAFWCGDYRVVFGREERADDRPNERSDIVGEEVHHIIISLNVGEGTPIDRLFPKGDEENASPVGDAHTVWREVAPRLVNLHIFPSGTFLLGEKILLALVGRRNEMSVKVGDCERRNLDVCDIPFQLRVLAPMVSHECTLSGDLGTHYKIGLEVTPSHSRQQLEREFWR